MPGFGFGPGFVSRRPPLGAAFDAAAVAAFAAMAVQPSDARKVHYNALIAGLKGDGVWAKLDWLSIMAAHDEQAGRLNLANPAQALTAVNAPTFTVDRGFTGNGTTQYLDSGWNMTTAPGAKFTRNDAHMGAWVGTNISNGQYDMGIGAYAAIASNSFGSLRVYPNLNGPFDMAAIGTAIGHSVWTRRDANNSASVKNGGAETANVQASGAVVNASIFVGAVNNSTTGGATPALWTARRQQACHWGSKLTAGEIVALYNRLATYMTAVGA